MRGIASLTGHPPIIHRTSHNTDRSCSLCLDYAPMIVSSQVVASMPDAGYSMVDGGQEVSDNVWKHSRIEDFARLARQESSNPSHTQVPVELFLASQRIRPPALLRPGDCQSQSTLHRATGQVLSGWTNQSRNWFDASSNFLPVDFPGFTCESAWKPSKG